MSSRIGVATGASWIRPQRSTPSAKSSVLECTAEQLESRVLLSTTPDIAGVWQGDKKFLLLGTMHGIEFDLSQSGSLVIGEFKEWSQPPPGSGNQIFDIPVRGTFQNSQLVMYAQPPYGFTQPWNLALSSGFLTGPDAIELNTRDALYQVSSKPETLPELTGSFTGQIPTQAAPGDTISPGLVIRNIGQGEAFGDEVTDYYLSSTPDLTGAIQPPIATGYSIDLLPGASGPAEPVDLTIPTDTPTGTYYLVAKINSAGAIQEADGGDDLNDVTATGPIHVLSQPSLVITTDASTYYIDANGDMPHVTADVAVVGVSPDPTTTTQFNWATTVTMPTSFDPPYQIAPFDDPDIISAVVTGPTYVPQFSTVAGGNLTLTVTATVNGRVLTAETQGLRILGTNPDPGPAGIFAYQVTLPQYPGWPSGTQYNYFNVLHKITMQESSAHQFTNGGMPIFNTSPGDGGAGAMQITPPGIEDVWDWKTNVTDGITIFNNALDAARAYFSRTVNKLGLQALATSVGATSIEDGVTPDMIAREGLLHYNASPRRHEYTLVYDSTGKPALIRDPQTGNLMLDWDEMYAANDYVDSVLDQTLPQFSGLPQNANFASAPQAHPVSKDAGSQLADLSGWSEIGSARAVGAEIGIRPKIGSTQLLIENHENTGGAATPAEAAEAFLGLANGTLSSLGEGTAVQASAVRQTVAATAGEVVSLDYDFLTSETSDVPANDFVFVSISSGRTAILADASNTSLTDSPVAEFNAQSGYHSFAYTFLASGLYTLAIGVVDVSDSYVPSAALISNVQVHPPGDANGDGAVAFSDLLSLAQNYGASGAIWQDGDFNGDGTVNFSDLLLLAQNYGRTAPAAASSAEFASAGSLDAISTKRRRADASSAASGLLKHIQGRTS